MSIMDLFRGKTPDQQQQPPQGGQQMVQTPQEPGLGQQQQPNPQGATGEPEGMDKFKDLFAPLTEDQQKLQPQDFNPDSMFSSLTPDKIKQATSSLDFTKGLSADDLAAVQAGGNEAMAALARMLNNVGQSAVAQGIASSSELVKQAMKQANGALDTRVASAARKQAAQAALFESNPALNHPAARPIVDALQQAISIKNPNATPQEIQAAASEFLSNFAAVAAGKPATTAEQNPGKDETDWVNLFLGPN